MKFKDVAIFSGGVASPIIITMLASYLGWTALDTNKPKKKDNFIVKFEVMEDEDKLEITHPFCPNDKPKGCFTISKKKAGSIKFEFTAPDETWQLTEFEICKGTDSADLDCDLGIWERLDFFVVQDDDDMTTFPVYPTSNKGIIDLTNQGVGSTEFYLLDQNSIKGDYFYKITACNSDDEPVCIDTDPPISNKGRGSS